MSVKTTYRYFCDVCSEECQSKENEVKFAINRGERDIGPSTIDLIVTVNHPYNLSDGMVCKKCQKKWLAKYIESI